MRKNYLKLTLLIAAILISTIANAQWTQIGSDIDGEAVFDLSGHSVSLSSDGSVVAIGAYLNDGTGTDAGHVRIYENQSGTWTQIGSDIDGEAASDFSGWSVSLSSDGSVVAIGAYENDGTGTDAGHVRIYENQSGTWTQIGSDIDGEAAGDNSGCSVSLSSDGSIVAIGAERNDGTGSNAGHVRIYENQSGTWTQIGSDIDGEAAYDHSGYSVSLSSDGSIVAIGAYLNDGTGSNAGHVRIYENQSGTWTQVGSDIDGEAAGDYSGWSVSLSSDGSVVAIGAKYNDGAASYAGHVRIYENLSGTWTQIGSDIDGIVDRDQLGCSVSLSSDGSVVAIGAYYNNIVGDYAGYVRIYENLSGTWTQIGSIIKGEAVGDKSGWSVSLSSDGSVVAIGAWQNDGTGSDAGHVRLYTYTHTCNSYASIYPVADSTYTVPSGDETYITGGIYKDTIPNAMGCDSLITIYLTINTVYVSLAENGITLTTIETIEGYRWIDCNDNNNPVPGETSQSFTATVNGSYAVIVYNGLYIDTSMCYTITRVGINENEIENTSINIYPNPTNGNITVEGENINMIEVMNVDGRKIKEISVVGKQINIDLGKQAKGIYLIIVKTEKGIKVKRVVLE